MTKDLQKEKDLIVLEIEWELDRLLIAERHEDTRMIKWLNAEIKRLQDYLLTLGD